MLLCSDELLVVLAARLQWVSYRQSFRHTLADAMFLTSLTLFAVPTFEFFSDVIHWRAHGHGWITE